MEIITGSSRTTDLLAHLKQVGTKTLLVCMSAVEADRVQKLAPRNVHCYPPFRSLGAYRELLPNIVAVDNIDLFDWRWMISWKHGVDVVTLSGVPESLLQQYPVAPSNVHNQNVIPL